MIPKNKAKELVKKFRMYSFTTDYDYAENGAENEYYNAKKCALIAVDEIFNSGLLVMLEDEQYWYDVKKEIENL